MIYNNIDVKYENQHPLRRHSEVGKVEMFSFCGYSYNYIQECGICNYQACHPSVSGFFAE